MTDLLLLKLEALAVVDKGETDVWWCFISTHRIFPIFVGSVTFFFFPKLTEKLGSFHHDIQQTSKMVVKSHCECVASIGM